MPIQISRLTESDIPGAVTVIQEAFANDPYNLWVYNDRTKLDLNRNRVSLGIRCRWGINNALFYVAKDSDNDQKILGIAMWMPPRSSETKETWGEWLEGWILWTQQVGMNLWYGRGGLNVNQGKGIGKLLAREVTKMADEKGRRCYLESSRDVPNLKIYEAMGFHFVQQMDCDDDGDVCKLFCMVREPQKLP
ncbi:related to acetyltransferase, GNAT family family [Rhynchosporium graminicola]|uniref:Related to acetyltransferase, GNAT family family n=1 Tax=Rhynchosporium graminicola TaxID=2792576 RepID=A0A1E1KLL4_9HELO|nr:related to acetyltransferase, GNAT family family [Rhynchosporium commune]